MLRITKLVTIVATMVAIIDASRQHLKSQTVYARGFYAVDPTNAALTDISIEVCYETVALPANAFLEVKFLPANQKYI